MSSLQNIAGSNHTCQVTLINGTLKNNITHEIEFRTINSLDISEGEKIRMKVVHSMFDLEKDLFHPRVYENLPLEVMPQMLELVQQFVYFKGVNKWKGAKSAELRPYYSSLKRLYEVIMGWNTPELFLRGPGKLRKKGKRKRKYEDDDDWKPNSRGSGFKL